MARPEDDVFARMTIAEAKVIQLTKENEELRQRVEAGERLMILTDRVVERLNIRFAETLESLRKMKEAAAGQ